MMIGIAIAMFVMNWKLALVVFAIMPLLAWISAAFQKRILKSARVVRATNSRITGNFNEGIMGILTSKAFVREDANQDEFEDITGKMYGASVTNQTQAAIYLPLVVTLASLATGLALAVGGIDMLGGAIAVSTLIAFMAYTRHFFDPIEQLGHWFAEMQMAQASAERIISLVEAVPAIKDSDDVLAAMAANKAHPTSEAYAADGSQSEVERIELKNVSFYYDPEQPVLSHIDLVAKRGETIAIVGPTGGGKSTLVNVICRFYEPTTGQVMIDGLDYRARSLHWLQSNIGMVLQNAHVFSGPIIENIRYGRLDATDAEVMDAARIAGAHEFIMAFPEGYQADAGEAGSRLSAGQKQLVSFARAILADPQILVMDEATSSVDTETEQRIQQGMQRILAGRIAFVIAHRLSTIRNADRIIVIEAGEITEQGTHHQLMASRGHYFDLYRQQSLQESSRDLATPMPAN
jgi:ATP-binding cassette subfamily B protein